MRDRHTECFKLVAVRIRQLCGEESQDSVCHGAGVSRRVLSDIERNSECLVSGETAQRGLDILNHLLTPNSPPREEGWLRHQEKIGEATLAPQTGGRPQIIWKDPL